MQRQTIVRLTAIVALAGLTACSGGGSTSNPAPQPPGSGGGAPAQTSASKQILLDGAPLTTTLPALPSSPKGFVRFGKQQLAEPTAVTLTTLTTAPAPILDTLHKNALSTVGLIEVLYYLEITPALSISFPTLPGFTLTLPPNVSVPTTITGQFFYAMSTSPIVFESATPNPYPTGTPNPNPYNYTLLTEGPATVNSNGTFTFDELPNPVTLLAGDTYIWVFYLHCDTLAPGATSC